MSEPYRIVYSPQALEDLKDIYAYISEELQVPDTARNQVNRIREKIRSLDFMPMRYAIVDWEPWKSMKMHKIPVDNFIVFYIVDMNSMTVTVIRIVYGGRDIQGITTQKE
ncbi:MAG: type II toxin-antitoxin system RelE/ParE family toxin [Clostridium sp.]|mgnify:FL=1|nr:type II toxin-antitoxin system RelE/ParE family toxin [Clostridium sp.]MDY3813326.1 type II toxin-antitoxin system RelE/ParE family toxin [Candidatus Copromonas sp.]